MLVLYKQLIQTGFGCYSSDFTLSRAFLPTRTQSLGQPPHTSSIALLVWRQWFWSEVTLKAWAICVFRWLACENPESRSLQLNFYSQVCILICCFILPLITNPVPQSSQIDGFPSIWFFYDTKTECIFLSLALYFMQSKRFLPVCFEYVSSDHSTEHMLSHTFGKLNIFYLRCVTIWTFRCFRCENPLPHTLQLNKFSPVCLLVCFFRLPLLTSPVPHSMQINGFPPACFCLWHIGQLFCIFLTLHSLQSNGFSQICFRASKS